MSIAKRLVNILEKSYVVP